MTETPDAAAEAAAFHELYMDALGDNAEWDMELADIARAKGTAAGLNCQSCGNLLGDNLGPYCPSCDVYIEDFNDNG